MQIMLDSKENCDRENTKKKKKYIKNVHYIYKKKTNKNSITQLCFFGYKVG